MSMTPRESMEAILHREQPEFYGDFMKYVAMTPDPLFLRDAIPNDGLEHSDSWGTVKKFPIGAPGAHPVITDENKVLKDIEYWEEQVKFPELGGLDWDKAVAAYNAVDEKAMFRGLFMAAGIFERTHFLMGMEDAFCAYLEEPEAMHDLQRKICDWKLDYIEEVCKHFQPDVVFYHDDWASKKNLFLPPETWREFIKPLQTEIAQSFHDHGILYIHHSDCKCDTIAQDMVELGVDIWQGVIPQNDIIMVQETTTPQLPMIGGLDGAYLDQEDLSEEEIRSEVRRMFDTYCERGLFFPSNAFGLIFHKRNYDIVMDEHWRYGYTYAQEQPGA